MKGTKNNSSSDTQEIKEEKEKRMRNILIILGLILIAVLVYALAAANTVPDTSAGAGEGDISGYDITNVEYNLTLANPSLVASVEFDVSPSAAFVSASLDDGITPNFGTCTEGASNHWTCTFTTSPQVEDVVNLQVVATD
jgi:hypothetical protein